MIKYTSNFNIESGYTVDGHPVNGFSLYTVEASLVTISPCEKSDSLAGTLTLSSNGATWSKSVSSKIYGKKDVKSETREAVRFNLKDTFSVINFPSGTWTAKITIAWSHGGSSYSGVIHLPSLSVVDPTWSRTITVNQPPPPIRSDGLAEIDELRVYKWENGSSAGYDTYKTPLNVVSLTKNSWSFRYIFDKTHVRDPSVKEPIIKVELEYTHYISHEKESRKAFFSTTRNQNYSNGIYNEMFVSGVVGYPNYTSRVWWSTVNDPLYFPDSNYSEVGSNDTQIMGLTKVGDYLAVVKQSKTTDTAIYLLYPTSFDENTTFAVKQGVQGVGALARYSFNVLGDETLFLSPQGVMAIIPTEDSEHKVQNRSYFVDGKLLKEANISNAYSFVYDGKYYLSMGNGHVYVLDGNQRNSWGNDRTNLVYECYYLENVPAKCFAKYNDQLVFTDGNNICAFNNGYTDDYDAFGTENVPVSAEWSTILDDDNALNYYKTMQKKGNLVSILPKDNGTPYSRVDIDEETFNANKTMYFTYNGKKYIKCKESSVYDEYEDYFVENRTSTKVFVKTDERDPVEIVSAFGLSSSIPSEMFVKKKFKKYKRLQFIVRNEEAEPFGVDEIVKCYTVGNYTKV